MLGNINSIGKSPSFKAVIVDEFQVKEKLRLNYRSGEINLKELGKFTVQDGTGYVNEYGYNYDHELDSKLIITSKAPYQDKDQNEIKLANLYIKSGIGAMYAPDSQILNSEQVAEKRAQQAASLKALRNMHLAHLEVVDKEFLAKKAAPPPKSRNIPIS